MIKTAEVKKFNGMPALFINGQPHPGLTHCSGLGYKGKLVNPKHIAQFAHAGVHLHSFMSYCAYDVGRQVDIWKSNGEFDFSTLDKEISLILKADPDALIIPRVHVFSPPWWDGKHPEELITDESGQNRFSARHGKNSFPSFASEKWRREGGAYCLKKYIEHVESSDYSKHIIGYHVADGGCGEWVVWWHERGCVDFSKPMINAFHLWLVKKYKSNVSLLRKAWADRAVDFKTAKIPSRAQREDSDHLWFRDPATSMQTIDYLACASETVTEAIAYYSKIIKEACHQRAIVGTFYGYLFAFTAYGGEQESGHLAMNKLLDDPNIDFFSSPTAYTNRSLGAGFALPQTPWSSVQLHGKLWFDENDIRTSMLKWVGDSNDLKAQVNLGWTDTLEKSLLMQQRQIGHVLSNSMASWWFDMTGGWYDHPKMLDQIKSLQEIANDVLTSDRSSTEQIAVVVDERSFYYQGYDPRMIQSLANQLIEIGHIGAPFGVYHVKDLGHANFHPHRLYLFLNPVFLDQSSRNTIHRRLEMDRATALWFHAPGYIRVYLE
ncbi:MAG: beta-galactosidase [Verrucomicrobiae bacterium]|nr:beta-galactosidase [Verrucomicrobiae bacterium]